MDKRTRGRLGVWTRAWKMTYWSAVLTGSTHYHYSEGLCSDGKGGQEPGADQIYSNSHRRKNGNILREKRN